MFYFILNFTKSLFFNLNLIIYNKKIFLFLSLNYLKKLFTKFKDERKTFLSLMVKNKFLVKFKNQNSILLFNNNILSLTHVKGLKAKMQLLLSSF